MPKSLGQIHTVNHRLPFNDTADFGQIDLSGELSQQLQHMVRQGNMFKVVGIDMTVSDFGGNKGAITVNGFLDYYAPTKGRCKAYRDAFKAMANAMKTQGIHMRDNKLYDFRVSFSNPNAYPASQQLINSAILDSSNVLCLADAAAPEASVFGVHNEQIQPVTPGTPNFTTGFNTLGNQASPTNFVSNEGNYGYEGNDLVAQEEWESIPFQFSYTTDGDGFDASSDFISTFQWRPDPALYFAMMCGLIRIRLDEVDFDGDITAGYIDTAVHVSGWKSIMGNPDKKRRSRSRSTAKSTK